MPEDNPGITAARYSRRNDKLLGSKGERLAPDHPGQPGPTHQREDNHDGEIHSDYRPGVRKGRTQAHPERQRRYGPDRLDGATTRRWPYRSLPRRSGNTRRLPAAVSTKTSIVLRIRNGCRRFLRRRHFRRKESLAKRTWKRESQGQFVAARKQHPAIESGIHALENHGLDRCLDYGIRGIQRYVSVAIVGRNVQVLGAILSKQEEQTKRKKKTAPV